MTAIEEVIAYAEHCADPESNTCKYIRKASKRFLEMYNSTDKPYVFSHRHFEHVVNFCRYQRVVEGPDIGKQLKLQPFQYLLLAGLYGFRDKETMNRWTRTVVFFLPRKNGKSTITSIISLYELAFSGEGGPQVYCLATKADQARIVWNIAKASIQQGMPAEMRGIYEVYAHHIMKRGDSLSKFKALSRDTGKTGDGLNPSSIIVDEAAAIIDRTGIEVLLSGQATRANPLVVFITTASHTKETYFYENLQYAKNILDGFVEDDGRMFSMIYEMDDEDDPFAESTWEKVCPMLGITISKEWYANKAKEVMAKPNERNEFLMKQVNKYVSAQSSWLNQDVWDKLAGPEPTEKPENVFIGFDLAVVKDMNAVCILKRYKDGSYYAKFKCFLPEEGLSFIKSHYLNTYKMGLRDGDLVLTEGNVRDGQAVLKYIKDQYVETRAKVIGYDPYNATDVVLDLQQNGLSTLKVSQSMVNLNAAAKKCEELIMSGKLRHEGKPFISWQLANVEIFTDTNDNIKLRKNEDDPSGKIDAIIAMVTAMYCALEHPLVSNNNFGFRGLISA